MSSRASENPKRQASTLALLALIAGVGCVAMYWLWLVGLPVTSVSQSASRNGLWGDLIASGASAFQIGSLGIHIPWLSIGVWFVWALTVCLFGHTLLRLLMARERFHPVERLALGFCMGYVALNTLLAVVGWLVAFTPLTILSVLVVGAAAGFANAKSWLRDVRFSIITLARTAPTLLPRIIVSLCLVALAASFLYALMIPHQSDALRYHLSTIERWLLAGRIIHLPLNAFANFPFLGEMSFAYAVSAGAPAASQLMHWTSLPIQVLLLVALTHRIAPQAPRSCALLPMAALASMPAAVLVAAWPFVDQAVAMLALATVLATVLTIQKPTPARGDLFGIMAAGAASVKYTMWAFAGFMGTVLLIVLVLRVRRGVVAKSAVIHTMAAVCIAGTLVLAVWPAKNFVQTHNPVYPLATGIFPGNAAADWSKENAALLASKMAEKGSDRSFIAALCAPVESTLKWADYEGQNAGPWPLLAVVLYLAALPMMLRRSHRSFSPASIPCSAAIALSIIWWLTYPSNRMLTPVVLLLLVAVAVALAPALHLRAWKRGVFHCVIIIAMLPGWLFATNWILAGAQPGTMDYLLGRNSANGAMARAFNAWPAVQQLNRRAHAPNSRVLYIGEHRIYGATYDAIWSDWYNTPAALGIIRKHACTTAAEFRAALRKENVHTVLYNNAELSLYRERYYNPRFRAEELRVHDAFLSESLAGNPPQPADGVFLIAVSPTESVTRTP